MYFNRMEKKTIERNARLFYTIREKKTINVY